jgi:hypothetical protein
MHVPHMDVENGRLCVLHTQTSSNGDPAAGGDTDG